MKKYFLKKFPNKLRILFLPSRDFLSFQVMVLLRSGADFEKKEENGLSHFLEHMCFKATKNRPSNILITQELDYLGAIYNAFTSREITGYYVRCAYKNYLKALEIVSDIYLNPLFKEEDIEKEKGVIIEEINMYHDDPKTYAWELWEKLLYQEQPAGRSISGTKENVLKFTRKDLIRYHQKHYISPSTLVVVSGNFGFSKDFLKEVVRFFEDISVKKPLKKVKTKENQKKPEVLLEYRQTDQAHLILGVRTFNLFDKRSYPLAVADAVLDGGMSALLFQIVREKLGAAYYVSSELRSYLDRGYWAINMGVDLDKVEEVLKTVLKEWFSLKKKIDSSMIKKAKNYLEGQTALKTENIHQLASLYGYQEILKNEIETPEEFLRKIDKVRLEEIKKTLQQCLVGKNLNLALIGPFKEKEKFVKILEENYE
ncbi:MAG: M16 family metallopeptidase [Candidatus Paceibacterota bacterium]